MTNIHKNIHPDNSKSLNPYRIFPNELRHSLHSCFQTKTYHQQKKRMPPGCIPDGIRFMKNMYKHYSTPIALNI